MGGWIYNYDNTPLNYPFDDSASSGIVLDNNKPIELASDNSIDRYSATYNTYQLRFDVRNGIFGNNMDTYRYWSNGLVSQHLFYYAGTNQSLRNAVNMSNIAYSYFGYGNMTFNSSGITFINNMPDLELFGGTYGNNLLTSINETKNFTLRMRLIINNIPSSYNGGSMNLFYSDPSNINIAVNNLSIFSVLKIGGSYESCSFNYSLHTLYDIAVTTAHGITLVYKNGLPICNYTANYNNATMTHIRYGYPGLTANFTLLEGEIYNRTLTANEIYSLYNQSLGNGFCGQNSDCLDSNFGNCVNGCCIGNNYNTTPNVNQCTIDSDCQSRGYFACSFPRSMATSTNICVGNATTDNFNTIYQNTTCYQAQFNNNLNSGQCPQDLLNYIGPGAACAGIPGPVCAQPGHYYQNASVCSGTPTYQCSNIQDQLNCNTNTLCTWLNNACIQYQCNDLTNSGAAICRQAGCNWYSYNAYNAGFYQCSSGNTYAVNTTGYANFGNGLIFQNLTDYYCNINSQLYSTSFTVCPNNETCISGSCINNSCTPGTQLCSNGINFIFNDPAGSVYTCNIQGTGFSLTQQCTSSQACNVYSTTYAQCNGVNTYYCLGNGASGDCSTLTLSNGQTPANNNCYPTLNQCRNALQQFLAGGGSTSSPDQAGIQNVFNLFLNTSSFGKMMAGLLFIILAIGGTYALIITFAPAGSAISPIIPLISGLLAFIFDVMFGLIPVYLLIVIVLGTVAVFLLMKFMIKPVGDQ